MTRQKAAVLIAFFAAGGSGWVACASSGNDSPVIPEQVLDSSMSGRDLGSPSSDDRSLPFGDGNPSFGDSPSEDSPSDGAAGYEGGEEAGDAGDAGNADGPVESNAPDVTMGSDAGCSIGHLVINEVRSRGAGGGSDEFIELWNPTAAAVTLDTTWTIEGRSTTAPTFTTRWTGTGTSIPAHGYFLIAGTAYTESPSGDGVLTPGVTDATSIHLLHAAATVDTLCYAYDAATVATLEGDVTYACAGTPADNSPHDDTASAASDVDQSLRRQHCVDSNDNATDFVKTAPATPENTASPPDP